MLFVDYDQKNTDYTKYLSYTDFINLYLEREGFAYSLITSNYKYKFIFEIIDYLNQKNNAIKSLVNPRNCSIYNLIQYEFREGIKPRSQTQGRQVSFFNEDYLSKLNVLPESQIQRMAPILISPRVYKCCKTQYGTVQSHFLKDGYHRVFAMVGRIIHGKKYIPMQFNVIL